MFHKSKMSGSVFTVQRSKF